MATSIAALQGHGFHRLLWQRAILLHSSRPASSSNGSQPGLLGLPRWASREEVKARYRKLAWDLHPDAMPNCSPQEAALRSERFRELTEAYRHSMRHLATAKEAVAGAGVYAPSRQINSESGPAWARWRHQSGGGGTAESTRTRTSAVQTSVSAVSWSNSFSKGNLKVARATATAAGSATDTASADRGRPWKWRIRGPYTLSARRKLGKL